MSNARSLASFLSGTPTTDFNFDSNSLVVDISENSVGIGTNAPGTSLELAADAESTIATIATYSDTNTHVPSLYLEKSHSDTLGTNTATVDDEYLGEIKFAGFSNDNTIVYSSTIRAVQDGSPSTSTIGTDLEFYTQANGSAMGDARMIIKSDGKVGIGTTAPEANLEVEGASAGLLFQLGAESGKNCGYMGFEHEGSHIGFIGGGAGLGSPASDDFVIRVETSTDLHFLRGTTEAMVLKGDTGNVGIGTTAPGYALDILAATQTRGLNVNNTLASGTTFGALIQSTGTATTNIGLKAEASGATNNYAALFDGGNVGIGILTPSYTLHAKRVANDWITHIENGATSGNMYLLRLNYSGANPDNNTSRAIELATSGGGDKFVVYSDGDVVNHDNSYGQLSDERIKTDIIDANSQWNDIKAVRVRNFKRKDDVAQYGDKAWSQIGVVAQELEKVSPKLIKHSLPNDFEMEHCGFGQNIDGKWVPKKIDGKDMMVKGVSYSVLYMKAFKALQEAMIRIETLETKVNELENA